MPSGRVVDDQFLIRSDVTALLNAAPGQEVAGEAAAGDEAVRLAAETRPDVVLVDIRRPGTEGIAAAEVVLADGGDTTDGGPKVLVRTPFDSAEYVFHALRPAPTASSSRTPRPSGSAPPSPPCTPAGCPSARGPCAD
ncbi:response regulator [Streptomyces virginiae]|uniref:response regulator n=1 Tax=Streptomyces virginiae TaxID=1961 RepID=UPI00341508D1